MSARPAFVLGVAAFALALAACSPGSTTPGGTPETTGGSGGTTSAPATPSASAEPTQPTSFSSSTPWPKVRLETAWSGFTQPLFLTSRDADPEAIYVVEKGGVVREARGNAVSVFLDVSSKVSNGGEQGLLSIAFPPGKASAERVYVCYTDTTGDVVVARYTVKGAAADPASAKVVLRVPHRDHANHNGGQVQFAADGTLYVGIGDGGGEGDPNGNGQNLGVLLAKILRIDVEGVTTGGKLPATYLIPPDNPFVNRAGARPETWAWGLRNPWRFSFDAVTRDLYIGDVGQDKWEEIDFQPAASHGGANYGWSVMEGLHTYKGGSTKGLTPPVAEYGHDLGNAVSGGYVYRGSRYPSLRGVYLFGDDGSGLLWGMRREGTTWRVRQLLTTRYSIASFGEDAQRELYVLDLAGGAVYHVVTE